MGTVPYNRLLTLSDLCDYYENHKNTVHFNAEKCGSAVTVQLPASVTFSEDDYDPETGLLRVHLQSCHIGDNRNRSNIERDVMEQGKASIYNRPILGYIFKLGDGSYDFAGHEMKIEDDGEITYEEVPVGVIPESGNAELVYDEEKDKTYLEVDGYIYEEYSRAADILKEKKEAKVSVELTLLEYSFNPKENILVIGKFYFSGITILGKSRITENPIEEGMEGSRITLKNFKQDNSLVGRYSVETNEKMIEVLEKLNKTISDLNINQANAKESLKEGGIEVVTKFEELMQKYEVTEADIKFEVEGLSDEELEAKFAEVFETDTPENPTFEEGEDPEDPEKNPEDVSDPEEDSEDPEPEGDPEEPEDTSDSEDKYSLIEKQFEIQGSKYSLSFELSHDDIRSALYHLLCAYEEMDNEYYYIRSVYDDRFVYEGYCTGKIYCQPYRVNEDEVALEGDRYELFAELLTASEKAELEAMRSNYSSVLNELNAYKSAEAYAEKMTVFDDESYAQFLDTPEFKELMSKEIVDQYSKEELEDKANIAFSKLVKKNKNFSLEVGAKENKPTAVFFSAPETKTSFLDGLLKK